MSPVRWRLKSSMGTTWLYPPPAAPPLMPKVGPMLGCRMQMTALCPSRPRACVRPTLVVVFPSPSGVGVIAVTSMYLPWGRSLNFSSTDRCTLALYLPYRSRSSIVRPSLSAISRIGRTSAACAISRSLGTTLVDITFSPLISIRGYSCRRASPPGLECRLAITRHRSGGLAEVAFGADKHHYSNMLTPRWQVRIPPYPVGQISRGRARDGVSLPGCPY